MGATDGLLRYRPDTATPAPPRGPVTCSRSRKVQDIVQTHRNAVLKATEDFDVVEELIGLYRMSVASGSLAVAHNALATLGRLQNLEPTRRVEVRNLDPDEMDRQIEHYLSIINHQNTKRPPEICLTRA